MVLAPVWAAAAEPVTVDNFVRAETDTAFRTSLARVDGKFGQLVYLRVMTYQNRIELIPLKPMKELRGLLKGIDTDVERDSDRV